MDNFNKNKLKNSPNLVIWLFLAIIPSSGAIIYSLYSLNNLGLALNIAIFIILSLIINYFYQEKKTEEVELSSENEKNSKTYVLFWVLKILYLIFIALAFKELFDARFSQALISPWQLIRNDFFVYYGLSSLLLLFPLFFIKGPRFKNINLISIILFYFLSFSVCLISYTIGYGFDPFIHQAAMEFISEQGLIYPKTAYYLGQYSLIITISKITGLSIAYLNKILVPLTAALTLPIVALSFLKSLTKDKNYNSYLISLIISLILGFSVFIVTSPQNLSYIFLIIALFFIINKKTKLLAYLFTAATLAIHPLTGIPALGLTLFVLFQEHKNKFSHILKRIIMIAVWLFNISALPLALSLGSGAKFNFSNLSINATHLFKELFYISSAGEQSVLLNLSYFLYYNHKIIILLLIISSLIIFFKQKNKYLKIQQDALLALVSASLALLISYLISSGLSFTDVINYEQSSYANRLLIILVIFNLPFILLMFQNLALKIKQRNALQKIVWIFFISLFLSTSLYTSYPRIDKYYNSRGYSTGYLDIQAVKEIETDAKEQYIVLANQQVSAAALKSFGFDHYLNTAKETIYFYPIPTGGTLYQFYLEAVYNSPSKKTMTSAMDIADVNLAYLVINKYWTRSAELINEAKLSADGFWDINNEVFIFKYIR